MIKPSVGRVVLFVPRNDDYTWGMCIQGGGEHAATIVCVHGDRMVNLSVFDKNGKQFNRTSVRLVQDGDEIPTGGDYCKWMEYQKGQAAKSDEAIKGLRSIHDLVKETLDKLGPVKISEIAAELQKPIPTADVTAAVEANTKAGDKNAQELLEKREAARKPPHEFKEPDNEFKGVLFNGKKIDDMQGEPQLQAQVPPSRVDMKEQQVRQPLPGAVPTQQQIDKVKKAIDGA